MSDLIKQAKSLCTRPSGLWEKAETVDGSVLVDPNTAEVWQDREVFNDNRRRLRDLGWRCEYSAEGWKITPPAPAPEPLKVGASPVERAKRILKTPATNWDSATVEPDGRTVRLVADRNPFANSKIEANLSQLRAAGWSVGEVKGPRGVDSYVAVAPVEKAAPKTLREALRQVPGIRAGSASRWIDEAAEVDGFLIFEGVSVAALNAAKSTAPRAMASGWVVSTIARAGKEPHRIEYTPPKGLVR